MNITFLSPVFVSILVCLCALLAPLLTLAQSPRERILLDAPWAFALGHAADREQDFHHATGYFSYLAKTGYGDGPASPAFDDRAWRTVQVPHDWAVEMPFDPSASHSHGYKALGPGFPQSSVGWYRHRFFVPASDLDRRITLEFEGVQRAARVFVNGFFVGEENLGNIGQDYDISAYLNYGGDNVIAVRADVSIEAGWYYEGAGINRNVWLVKTGKMHVERNGTFVTTDMIGKHAQVNIRTEVANRHDNSANAKQPAVTIRRTHTLLDANKTPVASAAGGKAHIKTGESAEFSDRFKLKNPRLWSIDDPYLYTLVTKLEDAAGNLLDEYQTRIGIRTIHFDPDNGFYLNGEHLKLLGSNNHEDHAGVGTATPPALIEYRLQRLKSMGMNTYRASHAPASPDLLRAADKIGMLVVDETRLSGINQYHLDALEEMIRRGRNHPSVILWSLGNEEWAIEGNQKGARIATTMQNFARKLDPTRHSTFAISGGWGGISTTIGVMGVNYIKHGDTDQQHKNYPWQIILGTEETTTNQTRGIYVENAAKGHLPPQEDGPSGGNAETGWQHYASRDYLAGILYWTGFDYRGEPTPYGYPAVISQFGILDSCGFPKDGYYYLKSWWTDEPVLHIFPHWNWPGREGDTIEVRAHSNADAVELFLNDQSLGKKTMPKNGHLSWQVTYAPGTLRAQAWRNGAEAEQTLVSTTTQPTQLAAEINKTQLKADGHDVAVININVQDKSGRVVPIADNNLRFSVQGPGKIIGVGNGDPSSHERDVFVEGVSSHPLGDWQAPHAREHQQPVEYSAVFDAPKIGDDTNVRLLVSSLGSKQSLWINGRAIYADAAPDVSRAEIPLDQLQLKPRENIITIKAEPFQSWSDREKLEFIHPAKLVFTQAAGVYQRKAFNGWAQVIVQSTQDAGHIHVSVTSDGLKKVNAVITANN